MPVATPRKEWTLLEPRGVGRWPTKFWRFWMEQLSGIRIAFGDGIHEQRLTLTFNFLSSLVGLLIVLTSMWSVAAGLLLTGNLAQRFAGLFPENGTFPQWTRWPLLPLAAVIYAGEALGIALLVFLAAASLGAIVGFLFGVPRPISESAAPSASQAPAPQGQRQDGSTPTGAGVAAAPQDPKPASKAAQAAAPGWHANTNLTQISDWLTKIIVGVSLVESYRVATVARDINGYVTSSMFGGLAGSTLVMPALMVAGLILGFMYSYLFTQLFLAALMVRTAEAVAANVDLLQDRREEAGVLARITPMDLVLAPAIKEQSSDAPVRAPVRPTPEQQAAAMSIEQIPLSRLDDVDSINIWARAQAVLNNYGLASAGYDKLLEMRRTPEILAEAARIFASAFRPTRARALLREAVDVRDSAPPVTRGRITYDAAHLALYETAPGGYTRALNLLDGPALDNDVSGGLHVLRACANGQRYSHDAALSPTDKADLRQQVLDDLRRALLNKDNMPWVRYLLGRGDGGPPVAGEVVDDDLHAFKDDPEFLQLIADKPKPA